MNNQELIQRNEQAEALAEAAMISANAIKVSNPMMLFANPSKLAALGDTLNLIFESVHAKNEVINELLSRELERTGDKDHG